MKTLSKNNVLGAKGMRVPYLFSISDRLTLAVSTLFLFIQSFYYAKVKKREPRTARKSASIH